MPNNDYDSDDYGIAILRGSTRQFSVMPGFWANQEWVQSLFSDDSERVVAIILPDKYYLLGRLLLALSTNDDDDDVAEGVGQFVQEIINVVCSTEQQPLTPRAACRRFRTTIREQRRAARAEAKKT